MRFPSWFLPTLRSVIWPALAVALVAITAWRVWPIEDLVPDLGVLAWALFGAACVISPDEVTYYISLRGQGYSSFTSAEVRTLGDDTIVRLVGVLLLLAATGGGAEWVMVRLARI